MRRASGAAVLALALAGLAACGDDGGGSAAPDSTSIDPGVSFEGTVTVPTTPSGSVATTTLTVPPGQDVESTPGEVPDGFPADFPVPDGAEVELGSSGHAEGERRLAVDLVVPGTRPGLVMARYRDAIAAAGFDVLLDEAQGDGDDFVGQLAFETDAYVGNVLVASDTAGSTLVTLTATLPD